MSLWAAFEWSLMDINQSVYSPTGNNQQHKFGIKDRNRQLILKYATISEDDDGTTSSRGKRIKNYVICFRS